MIENLKDALLTLLKATHSSSNKEVLRAIGGIVADQDWKPCLKKLASILKKAAAKESLTPSLSESHYTEYEKLMTQIGKRIDAARELRDLGARESIGKSTAGEDPRMADVTRKMDRPVPKWRDGMASESLPEEFQALDSTIPRTGPPPQGPGPHPQRSEALSKFMEVLNIQNDDRESLSCAIRKGGLTRTAARYAQDLPGLEILLLLTPSQGRSTAIKTLLHGLPVLRNELEKVPTRYDKQHKTTIPHYDVLYFVRDAENAKWLSDAKAFYAAQCAEVKKRQKIREQDTRSTQSPGEQTASADSDDESEVSTPSDRSEFQPNPHTVPSDLTIAAEQATPDSIQHVVSSDTRLRNSDEHSISQHDGLAGPFEDFSPSKTCELTARKRRRLDHTTVAADVAAEVDHCQRVSIGTEAINLQPDGNSHYPTNVPHSAAFDEDIAPGERYPLGVPAASDTLMYYFHPWNSAPPQDEATLSYYFTQGFLPDYPSSLSTNL